MILREWPKKPFWIHPQTCGYIFFFENHSLDLAVIHADFTDGGERAIDFKESAKELIDALEGNWSVAFLEALKEECDKRINENWKKFCPEKLEGK